MGEILQVAKVDFYGNYENKETRHKKYHILNRYTHSYCGKYLDKRNLKDGKLLFGKRFFKNDNWNKNIVCSKCLKQYIKVGFTDIQDIC